MDIVHLRFSQCAVLVEDLAFKRLRKGGSRGQR